MGLCRAWLSAGPVAWQAVLCAAMEKTWAYKSPWFLLHRMVTGTKATQRGRTWTLKVGCGSGEGGRRPAPQLFLSANPRGNRVNISIRGSHLTLSNRGRVSHSWLSQGEWGKESFKGKELVAG